MLSLSDINNKKFEKAARGYKCEDVDAFMSEIYHTYSRLTKENQENEEKIRKLVDKINEYREDEDVIKSAILGAQKQGNRMLVEAEADAKRIIRDATSEAEKLRIIKEDECAAEENKLKDIKKQVSDFKAQLTDLYNRQLRLIMEIPEVDDDETPAVEKQELPEDLTGFNESTTIESDEIINQDSKEDTTEPEIENINDSKPEYTYSTSESRFGGLKFGNNNN